MPSKFQIYVDQSIRQPPDGQVIDGPVPQQPTLPPASVPLPQAQQSHHHQTEKFHARYIKEELGPNMKFYFDERKLYPVDGGEYSFEELNLASWVRRQKEIQLKRRNDELEAENEELKRRLEIAGQQITYLRNIMEQFQQAQMQAQQAGNGSPPTARLSIVPPQQPTSQGHDADISCYGGPNETPTVLQDLWRNSVVPQLQSTAVVEPQYTLPQFTWPIDQSQFIRDNAPTSTPNSKDDKQRRASRRMSRPSIGGSPTMKLSPITETSRDCNSKSSSSSSAMSSCPGTTLKKPLMVEPMTVDEPDRELDPNDPTTYRKLLRSLADPLDRRQGYVRVNCSMPAIKNGVCFRGANNGDAYLVDKELSKDAKMFTAQVLSDDSDHADSDLPVKTICFRADQPQNDWLFYICSELHRRLVRQKIQPDIELSVMNAEPAIMYADGSILVDEYFRFVTIEDYLSACNEMQKQFPKAVAAYVTLELLQLVKAMHACDIIHMNILSKNIIITGCPSREDISSVGERTSIVKLIGFDYATDTRLLPCDYKFTNRLEHLETCDMIDGRPWTYEVDWYGVLACVHKMFFLKDMEPNKEGDRWQVQHQFSGFPTNIWSILFDQLLNIRDNLEATGVVDQAIKELKVWVHANISFVLKEAACLDIILESHCKATNKSVRI